ncbi:unnamed protein product [Phytomonas sp. Hart1]|nr:unnamed protein product [Phytomonas sp. Hart1]|eukprot:CCW70306.1 unnamed protein product [Phytomonas sp. isolate Hart1]
MDMSSSWTSSRAQDQPQGVFSSLSEPIGSSVREDSRSSAFFPTESIFSRFQRLFSNASKRKALISFSIVAAVFTVGYGGCRLVCRLGDFGNVKKGGGRAMPWELQNDGIVFADPVESLFETILKSCVKSREMELLKLLDELESSVEKRDALRKRFPKEQEGIKSAEELIGAEDTDNVVEGNVEELITRLNYDIEFQALQSDELLTQYVVLLDGLPVQGRSNLKQRRRALIQTAIALADRITPHLGEFRQKTNATAIQVDGEGLGTSNIISIETDESEEEMQKKNVS